MEFNSRLIRFNRLQTSQAASGCSASSSATAPNVSAKTHPSKIDGKVITVMFASLKVLGFGNLFSLLQAKQFAEYYQLKRSEIKGDIEKLIGDMIVNGKRLSADQVQIEWLLALNEEDVKEISTIIDALRDKKQDIFNSLTNVRQKYHIPIEIFDFETKGLITSTSHQVVVKKGEIFLITDEIFSDKTETKLLDEEGVAQLYGDDLEKLDLAQLHPWNRKDFLPVKIAAVNNFGWDILSRCERNIYFEYIEKLSAEDQGNLIKKNPDFIRQLVRSSDSAKDQANFIKENPNFIRELVMSGNFLGRLSRNELGFLFNYLKNSNENDQRNFIKENQAFVTQLVWEGFFGPRTALSEMVALPIFEMLVEASPLQKTQATKPVTGQIERAPSPSDPFSILPADLFAHITANLSVSDQCHFSGTNRSIYHMHNAFYVENLKKCDEVEMLMAQGLSAKEIFIEFYEYRPDRFVPCDQPGLNHLAQKVLGPKTIERIRNGELSIKQATLEKEEFDKEIATRGIKESARIWAERMHRDGSLSDIELQNVTDILNGTKSRRNRPAWVSDATKERWRREEERTRQDRLRQTNELQYMTKADINMLSQPIIDFAINSCQLSLDEVCQQIDKLRELTGLFLSKQQNDNFLMLLQSNKLSMKQACNLFDSYFVLSLVNEPVFSSVYEGKTTVEKFWKLYKSYEKSSY